MSIEEMAYDVKVKLNKLDSNAFRNLIIPEIDWRLNEALNIYINNAIASKRPNLGLEINERITGDISPLLVSTTVVTTGLVPLPSDYRNFVKADATVNKGCTLNNRVWIVQHEDLSDADYFSKPSFEWEEANGVFNTDGLLVKADGTIGSVTLYYIKKHPYIHNAEGYSPTGYYLPSGLLLQGKQDCILNENCHREIVDIVVAMVTAELGLPIDSQKKLTLTT